MTDQTKYSTTLHSKRILILGGTSGIGFCVAEACVEHGALVTIASSSRKRVDGAVKRIEEAYPSSSAANGKRRVWGTTVDLGKRETLEGELKGVLEKAVQMMGGEKLDHVVYTAGDRLAEMSVGELTIDSILSAGQIRFFAPLLLAKFLPQFLNSSSSSSYTITTGSVSEKPIPNWSVIGAYAGGLHAMVRGLALDLKPLRVNGVSPGLVDTELWDHLDGAGEERGKRAQVLEGMGKGLLTGRAGRPESVAQSFLGIMRDENMDATMVRTDGGGLLV
ncbi:short chain dehydrogenase [Curvularia clavata]|uniref:Short chain dehydrogenase n=1 Tax=Curvularia clavata TaxID=95742 RepID=A0A9Q8Z9M7_CURCL|nr:short chain dehydrogenase [Curvularia clavata]